jgi:hypothetical protein
VPDARDAHQCGSKNDFPVAGIADVLERVAVLKGGYPAWKDAGLPVEADQAPEEQAAAEGGGAGRMRPPDAVKCDPNQLTAYIGRVTEYRREKDTTILTIATSSGTVETVTLRGDPKASYLIQGKAFDEERAEKVVRPGVSAVAWVCKNGTTIVDWRPTPLTSHAMSATGSMSTMSMRWSEKRVLLSQRVAMAANAMARKRNAG